MKLQKKESAAEWPASATEEENNMGDHDDLPTDKEEVQPRRLHKESQPLEQLDMIIEEIRRLMIRSAEAVSKGKLSRGEPAIAAGQQMQQQQQQSSGADGQLQRTVWDPGGFQQRCWEAHEQELMNFSQQRSMMQEHRSKPATRQPASTSKRAFNGERGATFSFSNFENVIKCCKAGRAKNPCICAGFSKGFLK
jgi:hypothetical protein